MTIATHMRKAGGRALPATRIAVCLSFLANGFVIGSWAPQVPVFASRLDLSKPELGLMILVFGLGALIAMPLIGRSIPRHGSRTLLVRFHFAVILVMPFVALAPNIVVGAAALFYAGFTVGAMDVAMNANAVSVERKMRRAIMSSCHGFWSLGGLIGAAIGGVAIAKLGAVTHGILVAALIALPLPFVARASLSDWVDLSPGGDGGAHSHSNPLATGASPVVLKGAYGKALIFGIMALFAMIPEGAAIDWSASYLREDLGASVEVSGLAFAAMAMAMAVLRFGGDGLRDRFGAVTTARACCLVSICGLLAIGLAPNIALTLFGFALLGCGLSNIVPIALSAAGNVAGLKPGAGVSLATSTGYSGILVAPSLIGALAEEIGLGAVYLGLAVLLVPIALGAGLFASADVRHR